LGMRIRGWSGCKWGEAAATVVPRLAWLEVRTSVDTEDLALHALGAGERAAISLAQAMRADLIRIDERKGTSAAITRGFTVIGTLGVLRLAARQERIDIHDAVARLKLTNFRHRQTVLDDLLHEFPIKL